MGRLARIIGSAVAGFVALVLTFLFLMPWGCNDVGGVPSWERCITYMDTPAFSVEDLGLTAGFNLLVPLLLAAVVGSVTWILLGAATHAEEQ